MKVFISWSGSRSREVAEFLSEWLRCVLQAVRPWISSRDLDRGALWFGEIADQLKDTAVGIVVLTQEIEPDPGSCLRLERLPKDFRHRAPARSWLTWKQRILKIRSPNSITRFRIAQEFSV